jgi:hypothetical protein
MAQHPDPKQGYKLPQNKQAPDAHDITEQRLGVWTHDPNNDWGRLPGT